MKNAYFSVAISFNNNMSSTCMGFDTMSEAIANIYTYGTYHAARHQAITGTVSKTCRTCGGLGYVQKKKFETKKCVDCKGVGSELIAEFPLDVYHGMIVVENNT